MNQYDSPSKFPKPEAAGIGSEGTRRGGRYEVCLTIMDPMEHREVRMPPLGESQAYFLAMVLKEHYPKALVEIAYNGIRRCM